MSVTQLKSRFENLQASARQKRVFDIKDLEAQISILTAAYDAETSSRLAHLAEQAAIARKLGIAKQTSIPQPSIYQSLNKQDFENLGNRTSKIAIRKINRKLGTRFKQARPINRLLLDRMLHVCGDDLRGTRNRMILLLAYTTLRRRSELTSLRVEDLTLCGDGQGVILLRQSKTDQTQEGVLLALDIETTFAVKHWIDSAEISDGYLLRGITGNGLNLAMDPGQVSRTFKSLAVRAKLDPVQISGHSTRIGAAQDLLDSGVSIGQIMAKVGWSKVDTVMRYVGAGDLSAINSEANYR